MRQRTDLWLGMCGGEEATADRPLGLWSETDFDLGAVLEEVGRCGACRVPGFLSLGSQRELLAAMECVRFERAPERVADIRQDFDLLVIPVGSGDSRLSLLLALCDAYAALLRAQAGALNAPWLADFTPTDIYVQRYRQGSRGITPHRDHRRFVKLISIFSLGDPAEFRLCRDREGAALRRYRLASGDLLLLRAPGFAGRRSARPPHAVSGPRGAVRYSITLRMEQAENTVSL